MANLKRLKRDAQKAAKEHGHNMGTFHRTVGSSRKESFTADCLECGESLWVRRDSYGSRYRKATGELRFVGGASTRDCLGMTITTTKEELIELFTEQFDECGVPRSVSTPSHMLHGFDKGNARDVLASVIGSAYCAGFLWARHQCGTHPDYVIQPGK